MIKGIGMEIVDVPWVQATLTSGDEQFLSCTFTPGEQQYCLPRRKAAHHLAARLAAKRAVLKVLSIAQEGNIPLTDIDIERSPSGAPFLALQGRALERAKQLCITRWHISLTHTDLSAAAFALAEVS